MPDEMQCNTLMYVGILCILRPRLQAYIRSAGTAGGSAFSELVAGHKASSYIEYTPLAATTTADDGCQMESGDVQIAPACTGYKIGLDADPTRYVMAVSQRFLRHSHLHPNNVYPLNRLKCVGDGEQKEIGNAFNTSRADDSKSLIVLQYTNMESVTKIVDDFTTWFDSVKTVDLGTFINVTSIGNSFLEGCSDLKTVDMSSLTKVRSVGDSFLANCHSLTDVDLTPLSGVVGIGDAFMSSCINIKTIDVSALRNVRVIPRYFMFDCKRLQSVDLSPLRDVVSIGARFLGACTSLSPIDMSSLQSVSTIGSPLLDGIVHVAEQVDGAAVPSPVIAQYLATYVPIPKKVTTCSQALFSGSSSGSSSGDEGLF